MSNATSTVPETSGARPRYHRSARNYLLDRHFQLKYTGYLVGIAMLLSGLLGMGIWYTSSKVVEQSHEAVKQGKLTVAQGQETVKRHQEAIQQSRIASDIVKMNIAKEYEGYPELEKIFKEDAAGKEATLNDEQARLKRESASLELRAKELEQQASEVSSRRSTLLVALVASLVLLVLGVGVAGIVVTHKVAGPIFKMKRLLRQVGEGKLVVRERLRRGDELQHFFETFEKMVEDLRVHHQEKIAQMDEILAKLEKAPRSESGAKEVDDEGIAQLRKLRGDLQRQLEV